MSIKELVKATRSYRGYDESRAVSKEELLELVDCARLAASSLNQQPLKFYLAWEKEEVASIQKLTIWAKRLPDLELPHKGKRPTAFIVICQDMSVSESLATFQKDVGITAQTMLLAATEMGLGGCMIGSFPADELKRTLSLKDNIKPLLVVAIGKPAEEVVIREIGPDEPTGYYRDENDVHYVPKRRLEDIVIHK